MSAEGVPMFQILRDLKFIKLPGAKKKVVDQARTALESGSLTKSQIKKVRAIYNAHHVAIVGLKTAEENARRSIALEKMSLDGLSAEDIKQRQTQRLEEQKKLLNDFGF